MVTAVLVAALGIWLLLGFICGLRLLCRMLATANTQTILLLMLVTHFVGVGLLFLAGLGWAAYLIVTAPVKLAKKLRRPPVEPPPVALRPMPPTLPAYSYNTTRYSR